VVLNNASGYPVDEIIEPLRAALELNPCVLLAAPPGAGKSTILPLALLNAPWLAGKKIIVLEPRRLAAQSIASRMADLLNEGPGETVGYRIRFATRVSAQTKIEVVTEGILTRMLQSDNALEDIGLVIFDEFHERSLHADLALALCRETQQVLRNDLRILIMSATLNLNDLHEKLNAPVIESSGRLFPVDLHYLGASDPASVAEALAIHTSAIVKKHEGDVLAFLPGEAEIRKAAESLEKLLPDFAIHPLYAQLPPAAQRDAILPNKKGKRKVVLATSIAETSLTIEGVRIVIDSGLGRSLRFDPNTGMAQLYTYGISIDAADQRAGRAGRLSAGNCFRMWSAADHLRLAAFRKPEIIEADLCPLALDLAAWGIPDPSQLFWLDPPPRANYSAGCETLEQLGALKQGKITAHGKALNQMPCHPRIAQLLLGASNLVQQQLACDIAAVLEERDPLGKDAGIDLNLRIEALRRERARGSLSKRMHRVAKAAASYRLLLHVDEDNSAYDAYETGFLLAQTYPERIASARPGNNAQFQLANGRLAMASHRDDLGQESWLAVAHLDLRDGIGKIFLAAPLNPRDLRDWVKSVENIRWDSRQGQLVVQEELRLGTIVLQSKPLVNANSASIREVLLQAIREEGKSILNWDEKVEQLLNRLQSLAIWSEETQELLIEQLLKNPETWLMPYLDKIRKTDDFKKIPLLEAIQNYRGWEQMRELDRLLPPRIEVPSGSSLPVLYGARGETPVLAVRLQELFGLEETPRINDGKTALVIHLLSPGYKPVQVTSDLRNFWNSTYHEVKKELKRRYPKHAWPDDPWKAQAVAKGRSVK
jgi:ATP-dependent helicase HrpB